MKVLGIESSCDETGVAIYCSDQGLLAHCLHSQIAMHAEYGGVVPELASRDHIRRLPGLIKQCFDDAGLPWGQVDGLAFTAGPGLIGALMVGAMVGRSLAMGWNIPAIAVHHMEGHLLAPRLEKEPPEFPFVALLVSGGHSQLIDVRALGVYELLGDTLDDAAGEAFDKTAKMMGLPYPGGPLLSKIAEQGEPGRFVFPRPMVDRPGMDFSFSGLKTAVRKAIADVAVAEQVSKKDQADIALGFQTAVVETLLIKCRRAIEHTGHKRLVLAGGVSANQQLRARLGEWAAKSGVDLFYPRKEFCTDNGAMIAYAGCQRLLAGEQSPLSVQPRPRWPLTDLNPPESV